MFSIIEKLLSAAHAAGVKFYYNKPVKEIRVKNNKAESVIFDDLSESKADIIIANADLPYVYRKLLPERRKSRRLDRMKYSCSAICYHLGLDKVYPQLGHHSVFLSDGFRDGGSTHPGNGIPNVLLSAKLTSERILNKQLN